MSRLRASSSGMAYFASRRSAASLALIADNYAGERFLCSWLNSHQKVAPDFFPQCLVRLQRHSQFAPQRDEFIHGRLRQRAVGDQPMLEVENAVALRFDDEAVDGGHYRGTAYTRRLPSTRLQAGLFHIQP